MSSTLIHGHLSPNLFVKVDYYSFKISIRGYIKLIQIGEMTEECLKIVPCKVQNGFLMDKKLFPFCDP